MRGNRALKVWCLLGLLGLCMTDLTHAHDTKNNPRVYRLEEIVHHSLSHYPLVEKVEAFIEKK
ncbi:MAG: hypothetical protein ABI618_16635 [Nitrospirota bacterium]